MGIMAIETVALIGRYLHMAILKFPGFQVVTWDAQLPAPGKDEPLIGGYMAFMAFKAFSLPDGGMDKYLLFLHLRLHLFMT